MSDEESFVILGTSPLSSLEPDGNYEHKATLSSTSVESDTPGSNFSSLKRSQLIDLQNARETSMPGHAMEEAAASTQQSSNETQMSATSGLKHSSLIKSIQIEENSKEKSFDKYRDTLAITQMADPIVMMKPVKSIESTNTDTNNAESKLWSRTPKVYKNTDEELSLGLWDCAIKSPLGSVNQQKDELNAPQKATSTSNPTSLEKTCIASNGRHLTPSASASNSLASSFIMGEINADVLKTSVFSQFPSISMNSSAEEVVKLQNMVTENMQLKVILDKVNNTMRFFHSSSSQWQEKTKNMETKYQQELNDCQKEIEMLRKENQTLQDNLKTQIEAIEIARQKDREETIKEISEKSSLVENMRAQIVKLEKQQMASFEFVAHNSEDKAKNDFDKYYITRDEHELKIKELEKTLSELLASNLDIKDVEKQYIDELNCLKVNLASAEELIKANRATVAQLRAQDQDRLQRIKQLENTIENLRLANAEQNERILLLEQQNEVYRKDFEMEQEGRSTAVKEKQQILQDLRNLQKRNQELIEEHQKVVDNYEKRFNNSTKTTQMNHSFASGAAAAQTYFNNPQRPIRNLPSSSFNPQAVSPNNDLHSCPICNKSFKTLSILQSHVNDCIDKN